MGKKKKLLNDKEIQQIENEHLFERRQKLYGNKDAACLDKTRFGIAMSGGGIRSATINLGILKTLNKFGVLKRADYISTVSGGGYTGAYIQAMLKNEGDTKKLFAEKDIDYMRSRGEYMVPGTGWRKMWSQLLLLIGFIISLLMSWISPMIVILLFYGAYHMISTILNINSSLGESILSSMYFWGFVIMMGTFTLHFFGNVWKNFDLHISAWFNRIEAALIGIGIAVFLAMLVANLNVESFNFDINPYHFLVALGLIFLGFFTNPNATSFHRYYRKQLADAFLHHADGYKNVALKDLFNTKSTKVNDYLAPYPIINTCLNLQGTNDDKFKGAKANDYFMLSPLFCGSKLTGYVSTADTQNYKQMTLPAAVTISAAAVNPGMGNYSNKLLSIFTTIFNARLGFWTLNPLRKDKVKPYIWWPQYFFYELFSKIGTDNDMLNISDGGHIENLGVYELLRRNCKLIISVDAGADPSFDFADLENLTVRARNELGLDIRFREDQVPEDIIRPRPSHGYSEKRFAIADVYQLWEEIEIEYGDNDKLIVLINYGVIDDEEDQEQTTKRIMAAVEKTIEQEVEEAETVKEIMEEYIEWIVAEKVEQRMKVSTLVYVKSSVTAPEGKPFIFDKDSLEYGTYKYKIYHPSFPHEPTSDQFFDPIQWESYFKLGQFIGAEVVGDDALDAFYEKEENLKQIAIEELMDHFDYGVPIFEDTDSGFETYKPDESTLETFNPKAGTTVPEMGEPTAKPKAIKDETEEGKDVDKVAVGEEVRYKM